MPNVLIAEDDAILRKRLVRILGKHEDRFTVIPAADGKKAIDALDQHDVSLLITDIQMPHVDGLTLLAHISNKFPLLPCFVMTAYGSLQVRARLPKDLLRFYQKPFDIEELAADILSVLDTPDQPFDGAGISIYSYLGLIAAEQCSCLLKVSAGDDLSGELVFIRGELYDAVCGNQNGEDAARALIQPRPCCFGISFSGDEDAEKRIFTPLDTIIRQSLP